MRALISSELLSIRGGRLTKEDWDLLDRLVDQLKEAPSKERQRELLHAITEITTKSSDDFRKRIKELNRKRG
jgi:hypothetical protein